MNAETRLFRNKDEESRVGSAVQTVGPRDRPREQSAELVPESRAVVRGVSVVSKYCRPILLALAIWLPVAALALAGYFWVKVPLEERLLASETLRLVGDINSLVKARSSIMAISSDYLRNGGEVSRESLDGIFEGLQNRFPDFRRLELINKKGEITAMVGELPISQAGLASRTQVSRFKNLGSDVSTDVEVLQDDPEAGLFLITRRHSAAGLEDQFVRAKFARGPLELTLAVSANGSFGAARLIPVSGGGVDDWQVAAGSGGKTEVRVVSDLWHGPIRGEALLNTKGWAVTLTRVGSPAVLAYILMALAAFGGILVMLAAGLSKRQINHENREYTEPVSRPDIHPSSATFSGNTPLAFGVDKSSGAFGTEAETQDIDFWGEDYGTGDFFGSTEQSYSETSDDFFASAPTAQLGPEPDESPFGQEDHAPHSKEPIQITWYEPFGSDSETESESDTSHEVSADSGESFDRA